MTPEDRRRADARARVREWREQRTAAGRCHRCPRLTEEAGWFCRKCRIETAPTAREAERRRREQRQFLEIMERLAEGRCVGCLSRSDGRWFCRPCRKAQKFAYAGPRARRSSEWPDAETTQTFSRTMGQLRPQDGHLLAMDRAPGRGLWVDQSRGPRGRECACPPGRMGIDPRGDSAGSVRLPSL